jgi:hypothetical protein
MKKDEKEKFIKQAKNRDWDRLAKDIISLEKMIRNQKKSKSLNLLKQKLEIWESEKNNRVFDTFNMRNFLTKNDEDFESEYPTKTDT